MRAVAKRAENQLKLIKGTNHILSEEKIRRFKEREREIRKIIQIPAHKRKLKYWSLQDRMNQALEDCVKLLNILDIKELNSEDIRNVKELIRRLQSKIGASRNEQDYLTWLASISRTKRKD